MEPASVIVGALIAWWWCPARRVEVYDPAQWIRVCEHIALGRHTAATGWGPHCGVCDVTWDTRTQTVVAGLVGYDPVGFDWPEERSHSGA